jgi:hypothetical protein
MTEPDLTSESAAVHFALRFGIHATSAVRVSGGFSEAAVYRVSTDDQQSFALRCTPDQAVGSLVRLGELHDLLARMQARGISTIAVPMPRVESLVIPPGGSIGQQLTHVPIPPSIVRDESHVWQAERWIDGQPVAGPPSESQLAAALTTLHAFHETAKSVSSKPSSSEYFFVSEGSSPGVHRRLQIVRELSDGLLQHFRRSISDDLDLQFRLLATRICLTLDRWLPWLNSKLTDQASRRFLLQPVIRDLWSAHVLFVDDRVSGLIDLSAMASDHVAFDLSRLLRSWFGSDQQGVRTSLELGSAAGPFSSVDRSLLQALDAATVLLSPVTWLRRRFAAAQTSPCPPAVLERLSRLTTMAECFEPL